jgi:hypothetical protein
LKTRKQQGGWTMEAYALQPNEVVLYRGGAAFGGAGLNSDVILTNINLVLTTKTKKMFSKEQININVFPVKSIKIYNSIPQIKQNGCKVEIFFSTSEIILSFDTWFEAHKFFNATYKLISGKSMSQLGADKVRGTVGLVDSALGIDTVGTIKNVMEKGVIGTIFGGLGLINHGQGTGGSTLSKAVSITQGLIGKTVGEQPNPKAEAVPSISFDNQIETLKKFKELLDAGIITQEEFDSKKKQVMGL